jgi:hypothetical protein
MVVELILLSFLLLLLIAVLPIWPYSRAWGAYPCRGVCLVFCIVLALALLRWMT